jgi:hypothetical protein
MTTVQTSTAHAPCALSPARACAARMRGALAARGCELHSYPVRLCGPNRLPIAKRAELRVAHVLTPDIDHDGTEFDLGL